MKTTKENDAPAAANMPYFIAFIMCHGVPLPTLSFISSAAPTPVSYHLEGALRRTDPAMARGGNHALNHGGGKPGSQSPQAPPAAKIIGPVRCPAGSAPTAVVRPARHGAQREAATGCLRSFSSSPDGPPIETAAQTCLESLRGRSNFPTHPPRAGIWTARGFSPTKITNHKSKSPP
jgi:hypothetical protein